jgi:hypothetical protein
MPRMRLDQQASEVVQRADRRIDLIEVDRVEAVVADAAFTWCEHLNRIEP